MKILNEPSEISCLMMMMMMNDQMETAILEVSVK